MIAGRVRSDKSIGVLKQLLEHENKVVRVVAGNNLSCQNFEVFKQAMGRLLPDEKSEWVSSAWLNLLDRKENLNRFKEEVDQ